MFIMPLPLKSIPQPVDQYGRFNNGIDAAERILAEGKADFVSMCRPLPPIRICPASMPWGGRRPRPCLRCQYCGARLLVQLSSIVPLIHSSDEVEFQPQSKKAEVKKEWPLSAGDRCIQAMLTLCERGHDVTLNEKAAALAGM